MDICAELQIKDKPGVLLSVIEPISVLGGNIITIIHDRENNFEDNLILNLTIDIEQARIEKLLDNWKGKGIIVRKISEYTEFFQMYYLLIGNISAKQYEAIVKELWEKANMQNINVESSSNANGDTTYMLKVTTSSEDDLDIADSIINKASKKYDLVYVKGVGQ